MLVPLVIGYFMEMVDQYNDAVSAYKKGFEIDPNNEVLKSVLADSQAGEVRAGERELGDGQQRGEARILQKL
ncbi:hypothetical protein FF1_000262 [Malus domestica]